MTEAAWTLCIYMLKINHELLFQKSFFSAFFSDQNTHMERQNYSGG